MNYRQEAAVKLRPRWGAAFVSFFLFAAAWLLPVLLEWGIGALCAVPAAGVSRTVLTTAGLFFSLFLAGPLSLGRAAWYRALALGAKASGRLLFSGFCGWRFWQAVALRLILRIKSALWSAVFSVPALFLAGVSVWLRTVYLSQDLPLFLALLCISAGLGIIGQIACGIFLLRYAAAEFYLIDPSAPCGVREAVGRSVKLMKGKRFALTKLLLSLFPWWLTCLALSPALFIFPYFWETRSLFLLEQMRRERLTERMDELEKAI